MELLTTGINEESLDGVDPLTERKSDTGRRSNFRTPVPEQFNHSRLITHTATWVLLMGSTVEADESGARSRETRRSQSNQEPS